MLGEDALASILCVLTECRRCDSEVVPLLVALIREVTEYRNRRKLATADKPKAE